MWTYLLGMQVQPVAPACPAGSGKTTLLNSLAGQVPRQERMHLSGRILVNGMPSGHAGHRQGYVQQEDLFYSQLTVKWASVTLWLCAAGEFPLWFRLTVSQGLYATIKSTVPHVHSCVCAKSASWATCSGSRRDPSPGMSLEA